MSENKRYCGVYRCRKCNTFWTSNNSYEGHGQECRKCKTVIQPHKLKPLKITANKGHSTHSPDNCRNCQVLGESCENFGPHSRFFGEYRCYKCSRLWMSSNSWLGYSQACKKCNIMVKPLKLRPLDKPDGIDTKINIKRPHPERLCGKCLTLGTYCRDRAAIL